MDEKKLSLTIDLSLGQVQSQRQELAIKVLSKLTPENLQKLRDRWDDTVSDVRAFAPSEIKDTAEVSEILAQNVALGKFAVSHLTRVLREYSHEERKKFLKMRALLLAMGYGRGYDSGFLPESVLAGLGVWWLDVSPLAIENARAETLSEFQKLGIPEELSIPAPVVKEGEICTSLLDPGSIGLNPDNVMVWYMCRTLGCLESDAAELTLNLLGEHALSESTDPEKKKRVVLVLATRDHNKDWVGCSSALYRTNWIIDQLSEGAGRRAMIDFEEEHKYFDKSVSAFTLKAK